MAVSKLRELSTDFAVKIVKLCETIKGHHSLTNQLERSATSTGTTKKVTFVYLTSVGSFQLNPSSRTG